MNLIINEIKAREILDSRGKPTVEVEIIANNSINGKKYKAFGVSPSGASCGKLEAHELRDIDAKRFNGFGVKKAVESVKNHIKDLLLSTNINIEDQFDIDKKIISLDGTENKSNLGANATIATSFALLRLNALYQEIPLWKHINNLINSDEMRKIHQKNELILPSMPNPLVNILNGGLHADNNLSIQEFMIIPYGINSGFKEKIVACCEIFMNLKTILKDKKLNVNIGDEGGFAPNIEKDEDAINFIKDAIIKSNYKFAKEIFISLDVAASSYYNAGKYFFNLEKNNNSGMNEIQMIDYLYNLAKKFDIFSIEDPLYEENYDGWSLLTKKFKNSEIENLKKMLIVGDDVFVTNQKIFEKCIENKIGNSILIKPNQIGTVFETLNVVSSAIRSNYQYIISHRSGETEDSIISHFAVGLGAFGIKTGSVSRSDRNSKYNELIRIEEELMI